MQTKRQKVQLEPSAEELPTEVLRTIDGLPDYMAAANLVVHQEVFAADVASAVVDNWPRPLNHLQLDEAIDNTPLSELSEVDEKEGRATTSASCSQAVLHVGNAQASGRMKRKHVDMEQLELDVWNTLVPVMKRQLLIPDWLPERARRKRTTQNRAINSMLRLKTRQTQPLMTAVEQLMAEFRNWLWQASPELSTSSASSQAVEQVAEQGARAAIMLLLRAFHTWGPEFCNLRRPQKSLMQDSEEGGDTSIPASQLKGFPLNVQQMFELAEKQGLSASVLKAAAAALDVDSFQRQRGTGGTRSPNQYALVLTQSNQ